MHMKQLTKEIHISPDTVMLCGQSEEQLSATVLASALPNEVVFHLLLCSIQSVKSKIKYLIMCYLIMHTLSDSNEHSYLFNARIQPLIPEKKKCFHKNLT